MASPEELDIRCKREKKSQRSLKNWRNEVSIYDIEKKLNGKIYFGRRVNKSKFVFGRVRFEMLIKHLSGDVMQDTCI